jgi:urease gamma subunit
MSTFKSIQELMRDTVMTFDLMTYSIQELMRDTVMTFDLMTYSIQELMRDTVMANDPLTDIETEAVFSLDEDALITTDEVKLEVIGS